MLININYKANINLLEFIFNFESTDRSFFYTPDKKQVFSFKKKCYFYLPDNFLLEQLHPDRLALAIILCCYPFIGKYLKLPFNVSEQFSTTIKSQTNISIKSSSQITPLNVNQILQNPDSHPSLCLSMGMDSVAGFLIMPENTIGVFLDRMKNLNENDSYQKDCVYHGLTHISQLTNKKIFSVKNNMEYLRKSIGFMIDISVGVPAILLSNHSNFSSIGYGYSIHHFEHYNKGQLVGHCTGDDTNFNYSKWNSIFKSAGLYLNMITMGLTEIGTLKIVMQSPFANIATGCMRGKIGRPCLNCKKCYRKLLLQQYLRSGKIKGNPQLYQKLSKHKYHNLFYITDLDTLKFSFSYMTSNYQGSDPFLQQIKNRLSKYRSKFKYLDNWFSGAKNCIDPKTYEEIIPNLIKYNIKIVL